MAPVVASQNDNLNEIYGKVCQLDESGSERVNWYFEQNQEMLQFGILSKIQEAEKKKT